MASSAEDTVASRFQAVEDAIEALRHASQTPAKQRKGRLSGFVDVVCSHAFENGLDSWSLERIVDLVTVRNELDQTTVTTLIKNLYPSSRVSSDVVVSIIGALGQGRAKPSSSSQSSLIKWLTVILDVLEEPSIVSRFYNVLFSMLTMISLRTPLSHLLSIITRRRHVRPFRIQQLLELSRVNPNEPALIGLLRVYKDYYPDIIIGNFRAGRGSLPPHPDNEWRRRLRAIQQEHSLQSGAQLSDRNRFKVARQGVTRNREDVIPEVHTSHAHESSVTLEEINNADDLVNSLGKIEQPNSIVSALRDPLLQKFFLLDNSESSRQRLSLWLSQYFDDELDSLREEYRSSESLSDVLSNLLTFTRYTEELPIPAMRFFRQFLLHWDGITDQKVIVGLLSYLPLTDFEDLHASYLDIMETTILTSCAHPYETLLDFYTELLSRWIGSLSANNLSAIKPIPADASLNIIHGTAHAAKLASTALAATSPGLGPISSVLTLYEILSNASSTLVAAGIRDIPILLPPSHVVCEIALSSSLSDLSRLCSILATYKRAFEQSLRAGIKSPDSLTSQINGNLMDLCNLLWRLRAFETSDPNALGCLCPPTLLQPLSQYFNQLENDYNLSTAFGFSHSPVLSALGAFVLHELETSILENTPDVGARHAGPATQRSLLLLSREGGADIPWKQYRVETLRWLDERGVNGIRDLMYATMKELMKSDR